MDQPHVSIDNDELECPRCGGIYLPQESVAAIFRDREDGPGTLAESRKGEVTVRRLSDSEIPGRRDSIVITFSCETCGEGAPASALQIMQHKGSTFFRDCLKFGSEGEHEGFLVQRCTTFEARTGSTGRKSGHRWAEKTRAQPRIQFLNSLSPGAPSSFCTPSTDRLARSIRSPPAAGHRRGAFPSVLAPPRCRAIVLKVRTAYRHRA